LNAIVDGQTVRLPHNPGKDALLPPIEELIPKGKSSKGFFQKASDTVGYALGANKYALLPFQPSYGEQRKSVPFKSDILTYTLGKAGTCEQTSSLPWPSRISINNVNLEYSHGSVSIDCFTSGWSRNRGPYCSMQDGEDDVGSSTIGSILEDGSQHKGAQG